MVDEGLLDKGRALDEKISETETVYYILECKPRHTINNHGPEIDEYTKIALEIGWSPYIERSDIIQNIKPRHIQKEVGGRPSHLYYEHEYSDNPYPFWVELTKRATHVHYVGRTTDSLKSRLKQHMSEPRSSFMQLQEIQGISEVHTIGRPDRSSHRFNMHQLLLGGHLDKGERIISENMTRYYQTESGDCELNRFAYWR